MAACTPNARDMSQGRNDAHNAPDDPFDLKAYDLLDDIHNAVNDYTAHGMDAFEECLAKNLQLDKLQAKILLQGAAHLFSNLQTDVGKHMQKFEQAALRTSLRVPAGLVHPSALPPALDALHSPEDEEKADAQLAELRRKIGEVRKERMNLDLQTLRTERELARYGDLSELEAIAATVGGKENVAGDAAVIQAKARELELLVPQIMARQAARADTILDPQRAARLAERDMHQAKAAMGGEDAGGLREQLHGGF